MSPVIRPHETFEDWLTKALSTYPNTPDAPFIESTFHQLIFMYGTFKRNFPRYKSIVAASRYIGEGQTERPEFTLLNYSNGEQSFPVALHEPTSLNRGRVEGEVMLIPTELLYELDIIEANGYLYERKKIPVIYQNDDTKKFHRNFMYCYIGMTDTWKTNILKTKSSNETFSPCTRKEHILRDQKEPVFLHSYTLADSLKDTDTHAPMRRM